MEARQSILTPEQDQELEALVRIAHVIAYQKKWTFDEFEPFCKFMVNCLCTYWQIKAEPASIQWVTKRVLQIAEAQKNEMLAEFERRLYD